MVAIVLLSCFLFLGCRAKNPIEGVKLILNVESSPVIVTGAFLNAATGQPIGFGTSEDVLVTIEGPDKNKVVSLESQPKTDFIAEDGFIGFAIDEGVMPQAGSPIDLIIIAQANGYLTTSRRVLIGSAGGHAFRLPMMKFDDPPEGVNVMLSNDGQTNANGAVINTIHVQTTPDATTQAIASITIPGGSVVRDETGSPLVGTLTTRLVYFNNVSEPALASFPGGFFVKIDENENGNPEDAFFTTGGFIAVDVQDGSGRQAKTFSAPIDISVQIPGTSLNPETGQSVRGGDTIGIWSYAQETGAWKYERVGTAAGPDANGNFAVSFQTTHLSIWNLDWKDPDCDVGATVNIVGKDPNECLSIKMKRLSTGAYVDELEVCDESIQFIRVPPNVPVSLEAYDACGNLRGSVQIINLCANQTFTLNVTPPPPNNTTLSATVTGVCKNRPEVQFRPTMPVWYWNQSGCGWIYAGLMTDGQITVAGLIVPGHYLFAVVYNGVTYQALLEIRADYSVYVPAQDEVYNAEIEDGMVSYTVELPVDFCAGL